MKLIVVTRDINFGGAGQYIKNYLKELDADKKIKKIIVIAPEELMGFSKKVNFHTFHMGGKFFIFKEPTFVREANRVLKELLQKETFDLLIANHSFLKFDPKSINPEIKVKSIFHGLHRSFAKNLPNKGLALTTARLFHWFYSSIDDQHIHYCNKIIFVSRRTMDEAKQFYPFYVKKFKHVPISVDTKLFRKISEKEKRLVKKKLGLNDGKKNVLFVGRLEKAKGILDLIYAIKQVDGSSIRLIVIGDGPLRNKIVSYLFVKYVGKIPNTELYKYYNTADLFVLPSYYENYPMTVVEAKACGCKILASDVGDNKYIVGRNSILPDLMIRTISRRIKECLR